MVYEHEQPGLGGVMILGCRIPLVIANIIFAVGVIFGQVGENITLPLFNYALGSNKHDVDPFFVLVWIQVWVAIIFSLIYAGVLIFKPSMMANQHGDHKILFIIGALSCINGIMVVFASGPGRTPPYLQAVLGNFLIPMTIFFRWLILKKKPNWKQLVCAGAVLAGLFLSLAPTIFNLDGGDPTHDSATGAGKILWPMCFMVGFAPYAVMYVLNEKSMKDAEEQSVRQGYHKEPVHVLRYLCWIFVYQLVVAILTFWLDLIPGFGNASSISAFGENMLYGMQCSFGYENCGAAAGLRGSLFIVFFVLAYLSGALLVKYAEGATWAAIVQALVTPLGTLFWTLFKSNPFEWHPEFLPTTWFSVGALFILVPAIIFYQVFSQKPVVVAKFEVVDGEVDEHTSLLAHNNRNGFIINKT